MDMVALFAFIESPIFFAALPAFLVIAVIAIIFPVSEILEYKRKKAHDAAMAEIYAQKAVERAKYPKGTVCRGYAPRR